MNVNMLQSLSGRLLLLIVLLECVSLDKKLITRIYVALLNNELATLVPAEMINVTELS